MPHTRIIETHCVGGRIGTRVQRGAIFTTERVDVLDGNMDRLYSKDRHRAFMRDETVETGICTVQLTHDGTIDFDVGCACIPDDGDRVHILVHRIAGRTVVDLFHDRFRLIVAEGDGERGPPWRLPGVLAGCAVLAWLLASGRTDEQSAIGMACAAGFSVHLLMHLHRLYAIHGLKIMRALASRRVVRALRRRTT